MIKPTVGRIVWFWRSGYEGRCLGADQPMAATVAFVHDDRRVNLSVTDHAGCVLPVDNVQLVQPGDDHPGNSRPWCQWMPFQVGQAKAQATEGAAS